MIYDYLFYKGYQLGVRSKNFDDTPIFAGVIWVGSCTIFNTYTIIFLLEKLTNNHASEILQPYSYIVALIAVVGLCWYYSSGKRYKKIIAKFERLEEKSGRNLHPVVVIVLYSVISLVLLFLAAMYKNGDGIFR